MNELELLRRLEVVVKGSHAWPTRCVSRCDTCDALSALDELRTPKPVDPRSEPPPHHRVFDTDENRYFHWSYSDPDGIFADDGCCKGGDWRACGVFGWARGQGPDNALAAAWDHHDEMVQLSILGAALSNSKEAFDRLRGEL